MIRTSSTKHRACISDTWPRKERFRVGGRGTDAGEEKDGRKEGPATPELDVGEEVVREDKK